MRFLNAVYVQLVHYAYCQLVRFPVGTLRSVFVHALQGNCTGAAPTLTELGLDAASVPLLDLIPRQCVLVTGSRGNYLFSSEVWIDGIYFRVSSEMAPDPVGGSVVIDKKAWVTHSTFDWGGQGPECSECMEWPDGGFFVEGRMYAEGVVCVLDGLFLDSMMLLVAFLPGPSRFLPGVFSASET